MNRSLPNLGQGLRSLIQELDQVYAKTAIAVISEFGRTVKENGNQGTDHGHGNVMWLLGGAVRGGQIYGKWEGLSDSILYEGRDLPVTTDFREVFSSDLQCQALSFIYSNLCISQKWVCVAVSDTRVVIPISENLVQVANTLINNEFTYAMQALIGQS